MNAESSQNGRKDFEIPCELLPVTDFDVSEDLTPDQRANIPVGGFVWDDVVHEEVAIDFSPAQSDSPSPTEEMPRKDD